MSRRDRNGHTRDCGCRGWSYEVGSGGDIPQCSCDSGVIARLRAEAARTANLWGRPIWLVGSALRERGPRDWDVRVVLPDEVFEGRFGSVREWIETGESGRWADVRWGWSREVVAMSEAWSEATGLNVDFQVDPEGWARRYDHLPRVVLHAGHSEQVRGDRKRSGPESPARAPSIEQQNGPSDPGGAA
jgi:hypothetical protein